MLAGLTSPTSGQVYWNGTPIRQLGDEYRGQLLYCGHLNGLKDELSAEENLMTAAALSGRAVSMTMVRSALKDVGLGRCEQSTTRVLSQGQKRRVMLARLLLDPRPLWVLDEPLTALDADAVTWLSHVIDLHLQHGGVAVLTSHQDIALTGSVQTCRLGS
jgi:heme exporter protein A